MSSSLSASRLLALLSLWLLAIPLWAMAQESTDSPAPSVAQAGGLIGQQKYAEAAAMLEIITESEPDNGRAWMLQGYAYHALGDFERALPAHLKATEFPAVASNASYNAACAYALMEKPDEAIAMLEKVHEMGTFDLTGALLDNELASLHEDPRFTKLLPSSQDFADPFSEDYRIIHEWAGEGKGDEYGWIARNIGDADGDGVNDLTTSAPSYDGGPQGAGRVYTYSGKTGKLLWSATGKPGERLGLGIEAAGDVNADGAHDVIAGAPGGDRTYVFSGKDGSVLLDLPARQEGENFGRKVADLGDVDGDGHDDVLVGAPGNDAAGEDAGRAYVISGRDGANILVLDGEEAGDAFGSSGGGLREGKHMFIAVGAPSAGEGDRGRTYVYRDLSGKPAFIIESDETGFSLGGMFVSIVGDVDADGTPDVYASDWSNAAKGRNTGRVFVHSGDTGDRLYTFTGESAGDGFGIGVADSGDVDGDGHADLLIGAWQHASGAPSGGKTYLYSGKNGALMREWTCKVSGETFGFDTTGMGDVDGDGSIDFLITSAWSSIQGPRSGRMFILSGAGTAPATADR